MDTYIKITVNRLNRLDCAYEKIIYKREEGMNLEGSSGTQEKVEGGARRRGLNNRDSILNTEFSNHKIVKWAEVKSKLL